MAERYSLQINYEMLEKFYIQIQCVPILFIGMQTVFHFHLNVERQFARLQNYWLSYFNFRFSQTNSFTEFFTLITVKSQQSFNSSNCWSTVFVYFSFSFSFYSFEFSIWLNTWMLNSINYIFQIFSTAFYLLFGI